MNVPTSRRRSTVAAILLVSGLAGTPGAEAQEALQVPMVTVTSTGTDRSLEDAPASMTVITRQELESRPIQDLADALRDSPGITIQGVGLGRQGVSIRGMPSDQTLYLIDGRRVNVAGSAIAHADFDLNWVPKEAIERIEVVRGPLSSLYGSDALGGVVNVITRAATDRWVGAFSGWGGLAERGEGSQTQFGAYAGGPLIPGVLGLTLSAQGQTRSEVPDVVNPRVTALENRDSISGNLGLTWTPTTSQRVDFNYSRGHDDRWRNLLSSGARPVPYRSKDDIEREQISLSHRGAWGWGDTLIRGYRSRLQRDNSVSIGTPTGPQTLTDDVLDGRVTIPAWGWHRFSVGGELREERLEDRSVNASGKDRVTHGALFLQDEIALTERLSLTAGARFDHHEAFGWHTSPRAYLVWRATDELTFRGGVGSGFRAPTLKQLSPGYNAVGGGGRFTITGNPDLRPETNTSYEAGVSYAPGPWEVRATVFQANLEDLVETLCTRSCGVRGRELRTYRNVDEARIRGIEIGGGVRLPADFRVDINYTYLDAQDLTDDRELTERPRHGINGVMRWEPEGPFSAQFRANYVGRQTVAQTVGTGTVYTPLSSYTLLSLEAGYRVTDKVTLRAGVENIGDVRLANDREPYTYADAGRLYFVGLQASF
ncbi:TonB-dependent receptor domain-containing protein [Roseomonas sp. WA12]